MGRRKTTDRLSGVDRALQIGMAALGAILLLGSLGVVVNSALGPQQPALVQIVETERVMVGSQTIVQIQAINRGDLTASAVMVEGHAMSGRASSVTLDYIPGLSRKSATLIFEGDLGQTPLTLQANGWVDP